MLLEAFKTEHLFIIFYNSFLFISVCLFNFCSLRKALHFVYFVVPGKVESVIILVHVKNKSMEIIYSKPSFGLSNKTTIHFKCGNFLLYNDTFNNWKFNDSNILNIPMPCLNEVECSVRFFYFFFLYI